MTTDLIPYTTTPIQSIAENGTLKTSTGKTLTYSGGSEVKVHVIKTWFADDLQYYIKNTGEDDISIRLTIQLTPNGDELEIQPPLTLLPGEDLLIHYSLPSSMLNVYVTPTSSSSSWKDELIVRWY